MISKIPHFWALVFEQSPPEVDNYIQPSDSKVFAECLKSVEVERFEIDSSPRSVSIKFEFSENEYFKDQVLEKKFWFRKSKDEWQGLVSEPVKIQWKKGKDLTDGLTDAAYALYEAKQKLGGTSNGSSHPQESSLPEYKALVTKLEESEDASNSFFAWFGYVSSYKWVSAAESEEAAKEEAEKLEKKKRGEEVKEDDEDDEDTRIDFQETEVFPGGDELATVIAEDMWPSAIRYYSMYMPSAFAWQATNNLIEHAHEADDDEELSELEVEDMEDDSDDEIDIRGLVGKGRSKNASDSPPPKKQRKA